MRFGCQFLSNNSISLAQVCSQKKGLFFDVLCFFLKEKAWMEMIDGTKEELLLMSQWAINDEGGRGKRLFDRLKKRLLINSFFIAPFINTHSTK